MYRVFVLFGILVLSLTGASMAMADHVVESEVEKLRMQVIKLLDEISKIRNQEVSFEWLDETPGFRSVSGSEISGLDLGNFVYYRPVVWESAGKGSPGIYDHRHGLLLLSNDVEQAAVIFNDRIIGVKDGSCFSSNYPDPIEAIRVYDRLFPGIHQRRTEPLLEKKGLFRDEGPVYGDLYDHVVFRLFGLYPKTDHDIVIRIGDTTIGIRLSSGRRRMEYHREARLMLLGGGGISLHGYPETLPEGIDYKAVARTETDALGYLVISEIMRDITLLTHRMNWVDMSTGLGAPAIHSPNLSVVPSLARKAERLFFGVSPEGKKLTTWGAIKNRK